MTGIFGGRYFLKFFVALEGPSHYFSVEIPRDSNTLDKITAHHHRFGGTGWIFSYRHMLKIHCERTSLVYLEKAREFFARAQKQGSTSRSSADENGFGLPIVSNSATSKRRGGPVLKSGSVEFGVAQSETRSHREMPRSGKKQNHRAKARKSFEG